MKLNKARINNLCFIDKGFIFAYENLLDAITQGDTDYLMELLEPNLYKHFSKAFNDLSSQGFTIKHLNYNTVTNISIAKLAFHYGINFERSTNIKVSKK